MRVKYLPNDVNARLDGGICFYDGKPYVIYTNGLNGVTGNLRPLYGRRKDFLVALSDEKLDISSPELGYINNGDNTTYIMRSPDRRYKQTLSSTSMVGMRIDGRLVSGDTVSEYLFSEAGERMLLNSYPSLNEALSYLEEAKGKKTRSIAFHRDVALAKDSFGITRVYFKGKEVGRIKPKTKTVIVPEGTLAWVVSKYLENFDWEVK